MNEDISFSTEKFVNINDQQVVVRKMGLIKYAQIAKNFDTLLGSVLRAFQMNQELNNIEVEMEKELNFNEKRSAKSRIICEIIEENIEQVISFICVAVPDLDRKYVEDMVGIDDAFQLVEAIIEVNNLNKVMNSVKKFMSLLTDDPTTTAKK